MTPLPGEPSTPTRSPLTLQAEPPQRMKPRRFNPSWYRPPFQLLTTPITARHGERNGRHVRRRRQHAQRSGPRNGDPISVIDPEGKDAYFGGSSIGLQGHIWMAVDSPDGTITKFDFYSTDQEGLGSASVNGSAQGSSGNKPWASPPATPTTPITPSPLSQNLPACKSRKATTRPCGSFRKPTLTPPPALPTTKTVSLSGRPTTAGHTDVPSGRIQFGTNLRVKPG
jgi:hypothetical protein